MVDSEEIIAAFRSFDNEGSGKISAKDLKLILTSMGEKYTDEQADELIQDAGGGSSINYKKFVKKMNELASPSAEDEELERKLRELEG